MKKMERFSLFYKAVKSGMYGPPARPPARAHMHTHRATAWKVEGPERSYLRPRARCPLFSAPVFRLLLPAVLPTLSAVFRCFPLRYSRSGVFLFSASISHGFPFPLFLAVVLPLFRLLCSPAAFFLLFFRPLLPALSRCCLPVVLGLCFSAVVPPLFRFLCRFSAVFLPVILGPVFPFSRPRAFPPRFCSSQPQVLLPPPVPLRLRGWVERNGDTARCTPPVTAARQARRGAPRWRDISRGVSDNGEAHTANCRKNERTKMGNKSSGNDRTP